METKDTTQHKEARKGPEKKPALLSQELRLGKTEGYRVDQERGQNRNWKLNGGIPGWAVKRVETARVGEESQRHLCHLRVVATVGKGGVFSRRVERRVAQGEA